MPKRKRKSIVWRLIAATGAPKSTGAGGYTSVAGVRRIRRREERRSGGSRSCWAFWVAGRRSWRPSLPNPFPAARIFQSRRLA